MPTAETTVKERPLLYSGPMVRALLSGVKTQTRRVMKPQPIEWRSDVPGCEDIGGLDWKGNVFETDAGPASPPRHASRLEDCCPHGQPGDRLWVRETFSDPFAVDVVCENFTGFYRASDPDRKVKWKPSIFMPRWASRITLEITEVRAERAHDISDADILAEGIAEYAAGLGLVAGDAARRRELWAHLWDAVNGKRDGGKWAWDKAPWTWVISFRRLEARH